MKAARGSIQVFEADITHLRVDAIVNAANARLQPGGGVDGAINEAAGPRLARAMAKLGGCPTGEARLTEGYALPARFVIHTAGPIWEGGKRGEAELLARCYRSCFALASRNGVRSIAFPAISTGVYGFPSGPAADIAVAEGRNHLGVGQAPDEIVFACFDPATAAAYQRALAG